MPSLCVLLTPITTPATAPQAELSMIGAARDAEMSLAAAKWEEALVRVEDERDELAARGRHQLNQIKEIRWGAS